ncbi:MAG TPA: VWA domain-containing protein, partial [Anaerolineae bacterium]|nr:VWA domain-containing protein [Anaerolineae bacterium]
GAAESTWAWRRLSKGEGGNQGDTVWLAAGDHTLHLWAGGSGFDVDRMIISTDGTLDSTEQNFYPNDGRTGWACEPCDPRFAGRPGGAIVCDPDDPSSCTYRPDCSAGGNPDQRKNAIYDDEQPIRNALEAAKHFVGRLNPRFDQVGYVRYSTDAQIANELQCLRRLGADNCTAQVITDTVLYALDRTRAGGSTNIAEGIKSGIDVLSTAAPHYGRPGAARVMVLMTDGQANRYPNYPDYHECWQEDLWPDVGNWELDRAADCVVHYAQEARDNGIAICTISLGRSADRELMTEVAHLTGCTQHGADRRGELDHIFDELYERIFLRLTAQKTPSEETAVHGQAITYTIAVRSLTSPLTATVHLTDVVPIGLSYVPGTLTSTVGTVTDDDAPTLHWSGVLSPIPAVIVTYGVTVSATAPQIITNTAVIAATGYQAISRTATVTVVQAPGQPDLTPSYKAVSPQYAVHGERVTYTIAIHNATSPLPNTIPPSPKGCQQLLQAGSFEGNPDTVFGYWHAGEPLAYRHQSDYVYDGSMSMRLHASMGSFPECPAFHPYLWQTMTIPEEVYTTTTMVVQGQRLVAGSLAPCSIADSAEADDKLYVQLQGVPGAPSALIADGGAATETWKFFSVDLTEDVDLRSLRGQEVQIRFYAEHDADYNDTWFYLDALECAVCTEWLIHLADTVPDGLSYVSGTLTATAGTVTDVAAPTLRWSGVLSPTRDVTVTYAVTVSATAPRVITNTAVITNTEVITVPGYQTISRTATVWANPYRVFLPVVMRNGPGSAKEAE